MGTPGTFPMSNCTTVDREGPSDNGLAATEYSTVQCRTVLLVLNKQQRLELAFPSPQLERSGSAAKEVGTELCRPAWNFASPLLFPHAACGPVVLRKPPAVFLDFAMARRPPLLPFFRGALFCWPPRLRRSQKETYPRSFLETPKSYAGHRRLSCWLGNPVAAEGGSWWSDHPFLFWAHTRHTRHTRDWGILQGSHRAPGRNTVQ